MDSTWTTKSRKGRVTKPLQLHEPELLGELTQDFQSGSELNWPLLSKDKVHRVWSDFSQDGYVRDERALEEIYASLRDNAVRLRNATTVAGHENMNPADYLEDDLDPAEHQKFCSWLVEHEGGWRISDYGLAPLYTALALAFEARTPAAKLKFLDRALSVTHMRGDLSRFFIAGGRNSVRGSKKPFAKPSRHNNRPSFSSPSHDGAFYA